MDKFENEIKKFVVDIERIKEKTGKINELIDAMVQGKNIIKNYDEIAKIIKEMYKTVEKREHKL